MDEPVNAVDTVLFCRWLVQQDVEGRLSDPVRILVGYSVYRVVLWQPSRPESKLVDTDVVTVAAPNGGPIGGLELKPVVEARSDVLPLVRWATEDFRFLDVGVERPGLG